MAKLKVVGIVAGVIAVLALAIYVTNLPCFSNEISMKKAKAIDLAKADFEAGNVRFFEVYKEDTKEPANSKWEVPSSREIGKASIERYTCRIRVEKDRGVDEKTFKKDEMNYAVAYNKTMAGLVNERDKSLIAQNPPQKKDDAAQKKDTKADSKKKDTKQAAKPPPPPPPPPVIIDSGDIPMAKVKPQDLAKTDIDRGKLRLIEVYKEDPKKPGSGKYEVPFAKEIGKELLEKYPERIRIEKPANADPKKFPKDEWSYASTYNKAIFKTLNPEAPMFKPAPPKQSTKKPADQAKPADDKKKEDKKTEQPKPAEKNVEPKPAVPPEDPMQQKLEQSVETPLKALESKDDQLKVEQPAQENKVEKAEEKPVEPVQPAPTEKPEEQKKPEVPAEAPQPATEKPAEPENM